MAELASKRIYSTAVTLQGLGYVPIPLRKGSKHIDIERIGYDPLHFQTRRKKLKELIFDSMCFCLSQQPPTLGEVKRWFEDFDGNIGVVGGRSGLVILDFDDQSIFKAWQEKHSDFAKAAPIISTPKGFHVFLRTETPLESSSLYFGSRKAGHLKSLGGYVVTAPSVLSAGKQYVCIESALPPIKSLPQFVDLESLGLFRASRLARSYNKVLERGFFVPE